MQCEAYWLIKTIITLLLIIEFLFPITMTTAEIDYTEPEIIQVSVPSTCLPYYDEISKYDWDVNIAMQIVNLESGCDPTNHNFKDNHRNRQGETICKGSWNLFNVGCINYLGEDINDWKKNVEIAYRVYKQSGWKAWSSYDKIK